MELTTKFITQDSVQRERQNKQSALSRTIAYFTRKGRWRLAATLCVMLVVFFLIDMALLDSRSATVTMSLNYGQASDGLTPNATRFNMYEIKTEPVLQKMISYAGLEGEVTTEMVSECISVEAALDSGSGNDDDFISTSYRIKFSNFGKFPAHSADVMLTLLCKAYREYFYENYAVSNTSAGKVMDDLDISSEYLSRIDVFLLKLNHQDMYA